MIIIKEQDNTSAANAEYRNFSVVVPINKACFATNNELEFDENDVVELVNAKTFKDSLAEKLTDEIDKQACQVVYELLRLGYVVLCKKYEKAEDLEKFDWWEPLKDRAIYDFRYVTTGCIINNKKVNRRATALAALINETPRNNNDGRGDCFAIIDIDKELYAGKSQKDAVGAIRGDVNELVNSYSDNNGERLQYAEFIAPFIEYENGFDVNFSTNNCFPGSFHYLLCASYAFNNLGYNEWFAVAGEERGKGVFKISRPKCIFGESALKELMPRSYDKANGGIMSAVNLVIKTRKGFLLWGNRTAKVLPTKAQNGEVQKDLQASHFLNIRQLCCTLKKEIYAACRRFSFNPNSDILWINFCDAIRPILEKMKAYEGIDDYEFVKIQSKEKATLKALIRIIPIEAVEDFKIGVTLEDSMTGTIDVSFLED